jgi:hypothetical protein
VECSKQDRCDRCGKTGHADTDAHLSNLSVCVWLPCQVRTGTGQVGTGPLVPLLGTPTSAAPLFVAAAANATALLFETRLEQVLYFSGKDMHLVSGILPDAARLGIDDAQRTDVCSSVHMTRKPMWSARGSRATYAHTSEASETGITCPGCAVCPRAGRRMQQHVAGLPRSKNALVLMVDFQGDTVIESDRPVRY